MGKLLHYLKAYTKESILGPLFKLLEASFELLIPIVMAHIIDEGINNRDMPYILQMGAIIIALGVIGLVCSITAQYFAAKAAVGFATALRYDLFRHIQSLSYSAMDTIGTSTLITRMTSDINQVQSGLNLVLRLFLRSPFIVFGSMVMAFTINVKAALVFVVTIPLLSIVVFGVMIISMPLYRNVQNRLDKVLLHTRENLSGARVIRAFQLGRHALHLPAVKNAHQNGLYHVVEVVPERDLVAPEPLRLLVQVPSPHARAQITRVLFHRRNRVEDLRLKNMHGQLQKRGVLFDERAVLRRIPGIHHQKTQPELHGAVPLQLLHALGEEHGILPARNTGGDGIPLGNEGILLYRAHETAPNRFAVRGDDAALYIPAAAHFPAPFPLFPYASMMRAATVSGGMADVSMTKS